ncbi:MAG: FAD-dependent oxidoreductase [Ilumatobacteraceae bacterium]
MTLPNPFDVDVVVVGAGFAGLSVATELHREHVSFMLLEARRRVGGKTEARHDGLGRWVDTGGQFANRDMTEVLALAAAAGATRVNAVHPGKAVTVPHGLEGDPWRDAEAWLATLGSEQFDDDRTVTSWAAALDVPASVRDAIRSVVNGATCHDGRLTPISYLAQLNERTPAGEEELQLWFAETMHSLALHLAAPLAEQLRLECPVRAVHLHDESVDVVALDHVWHAREVVVAVPPTAYSSIRFTPPLPDDIAAAAGAFAPGTVLKYTLAYERPFWLDGDRNGTGRFLSPPGVYFADASLPEAPTVVGFVGGTTAVEWTRHSVEQRHNAIVHHAAEAFGAAALRPIGVVERLWAPDELGGGGYSNVLTSHAPTAVDLLAAGMPLVTFASTELALRFPGYVEGALRAGRSAAAEVLRRLGRT